MSSKPRILVVDDEPQIHRFLGPALEAAGYVPMRADTGQEGLALLATRRPDALILDLGLPDMDGKAVLERARAFYDGPLLILSARDRELEKIDALDLGADDYVQKPFGVGELLARLRVAIRNKLAHQGGQPVVQAGEVQIDLVRRLVTRAGAPVRLTPREYDVLAELVKGAGRVLTHRQLLAAVWGPAHADDVQYLRIVVQHLRQKLEAEPNAPQLITTEAGVGYRFVVG
jgi:two-component system, OmpR family, KDP operon response regulator KdpE